MGTGLAAESRVHEQVNRSTSHESPLPPAGVMVGVGVANPVGVGVLCPVAVAVGVRAPDGVIVAVPGVWGLFDVALAVAVLVRGSRSCHWGY